MSDDQTIGNEQAVTYHRFVKTTPKPSATKNNSGELELPPPPEPLPPVGLVDGEDVAVVVAIMSSPAYFGD